MKRRGGSLGVAAFDIDLLRSSWAKKRRKVHAAHAERPHASSLFQAASLQVSLFSWQGPCCSITPIPL